MDYRKILAFCLYCVCITLVSSCISPKEDTPVSSVTIAQDTAELTEGETLQLMATVSPADATNKDLTWTSSNTSVATVSDNGYVSAIKAGTSVIYAMAETKKAQCVITVRSRVIPVESITISQSTVSLEVGQNVGLIATVLPENATDKNVAWQSSDNSIATVIDGMVSALKPGSAIVSATAGGRQSSCLVNVTPAKVTALRLNKTSLSLLVGKSETLSVEIEPKHVTGEILIWSSSDPAVASVNSEGVVHANQEGQSLISVSTSDGQISTTCTVSVKGLSGSIDGHMYVNLGLPSGTLWSTCNFGGEKDTDPGTYNKWQTTDIVSASWGSKWVTPSVVDCRELLTICTCKWSVKDGVNGYLITGPSGASIFLPAAGFKKYSSALGSYFLDGLGNSLTYWSSTPSGQSFDNYAFVFSILGSSTSISADVSSNAGILIAPIRPVSKGQR